MNSPLSPPSFPFHSFHGKYSSHLFLFSSLSARSHFTPIYINHLKNRTSSLPSGAFLIFGKLHISIHQILSQNHAGLSKMPRARGIKCFLSTNHGKDLITEYPHPEGTSMRLGDGQGLGRYAPLPKIVSDGPSSSSSPFPIRGTKTNPTASVYVPSSPGMPTFPSEKKNKTES